MRGEIFSSNEELAWHNASEKRRLKTMGSWRFGLGGWKIPEELGRLEAWDPWGKSANGCLIALQYEDWFLQQQVHDQFLSGETFVSSSWPTEFLSDSMGIHQATLPQDLVMSAWGPRSRFSSQMSGKGVGLQLMSWLPRIRVKPWMFSWFFHHAALGGFNDGLSIKCSTDLDDFGGHPGTHLMKPPCGGFLT